MSYSATSYSAFGHVHEKESWWRMSDFPKGGRPGGFVGWIWSTPCQLEQMDWFFDIRTSRNV